MKQMPRLLWICLSLFGISLMVYCIILKPQQKYYYQHHVAIKGIYFLKPVTLGHFVLTDNHAKTFTEENLKNHWSLVFFGFTHCPQVCPVTLDALNKAYQLLEKKLPPNELPQVVFVTIDPENDSMARLNQYLNAFNKHFIGASTTLEKTADIEKLFFVTAEKVPDSGTYTFNHSAEIILINPDAKIQALFSYPPQPLRLAEDYYSVIKQYAKNKDI